MSATITISGFARTGAVSLTALALAGCVSLRQQPLGRGEQPILVGPTVRDNRTPMDPALTCFGAALAKRGGKPLIVGVGDVRDYTGKYSVSEGSAITQGGALMVYSALGKLGGAVTLAERFDPTIAERELGYTDRRQLGDGLVHDLSGPSGSTKVPWVPYFGGTIAASNYYVVGGITELNYNIRSGGIETGVGSIGPKARIFSQSVAVDLRIVDSRSLLVVKTVSLTKQFVGYEVGFNLFRFFGSNLFDVNLGAKGQEPLQLGIRTTLEEATIRLIGGVASVDPEPCILHQGWSSPPVTPLVSYAALVGNPAVATPATIAALNAVAGSSGETGSVAVTFEPGAPDLSGAEAASLDQIASSAAKGAIELVLTGRDSETLEPAKRDALTDQRIASIVARLTGRGIAASRIALSWRPPPLDPSVRRGAPGMQELARLRIAG